MGNQAFAWAALQAGVRAVAGYPGTPSSELIETVALLRAQGIAHDVYVEWSTNEKAALEVLAGASAAGARSLFTCKQVGLNVASDALLSLNYVGIRGGMVLFVADDPGPISSQTEQDTRRFAAFAKVPVLDPATPEQGADMMRYAFELSEDYHTPVIVRPTTRICHASTFFDIPEETRARPIPEGGFERDPKWVIFPKRSYEAHGEINARLKEITQRESQGAFNPVYTGGTNASDASHPRNTIGIIAGGVSVQYVREALSMLDEAGVCMPYKLMQIGTPYPFPEQAVRDFCADIRDVVVVEELDYVLEEALLALVGKHHLDVQVYGKLTETIPDRGELSTEEVTKRLRAFFSDRFDLSEKGVSSPCAVQDSAELTSYNAQTFDEVTPPARPPILCAGCPHRGAFYAVKRALRRHRFVLCGDIGCYTLGNAQPLDAVDTCLCMGAGITMAQGISAVDPDCKTVAFVGDSTFFASGLTGIANAVYNQHDVTVVVLDNSTTAMTGGQPHPGTGQTLMGEQSCPIDIEGVLRALGMQCVVRANPLYLKDALSAARKAIDFAGPSAILFEAPCMQMVSPEPVVDVSEELCTGCKVCISTIGCPAMSMEALPDDQLVMRVDEALCYGCGLCVDLCPHKAISAPVRTDMRVPFDRECAKRGLRNATCSQVFLSSQSQASAKVSATQGKE